METLKNSLYFWKRNFLPQILKKFLIFFYISEKYHSYILISSIFSYKISYIFSKESFSYISKKETLHFSAQALKIKELNPRKIYYTPGNENRYVILYLIFFLRIFFIKDIRRNLYVVSNNFLRDFFSSLIIYLHSSKNT